MDNIAGRFFHSDLEGAPVDERCLELIQLYRESFSDLSSSIMLNCTIEDFLKHKAPNVKTLLNYVPEHNRSRARLISVMNVLYFQDVKSKAIRKIHKNNTLVKNKETINTYRANIVEKAIRDALEVLGNFDMAIADNIGHWYREYLEEEEVYVPLEKYLAGCKSALESAIKGEPIVKDLHNLYRASEENDMKGIMAKIMLNIHELAKDNTND